ncbi:MAG TPA: hypothetical protein VKS01_06850 [Bryobacteraceae bacterium]|nr:hypothetical protein [Bryobacteraceae bacterium]
MNRITGRELIREIDQTITATPTLWWLGGNGFIVRFANITFYIDPAFDLFDGAEIRHADLILGTHAAAIDGAPVERALEASKSAKLVLPKSAADAAHARGIPYNRMTTTDADLRVEYFKGNLYGRIYAVPSANPSLDWTAGGGYPYLGYLIRFGRWTIYHAGGCALYESLAARLKPFNVSLALLPVSKTNFSPAEAAQLAEDIGAQWVSPMGAEDQGDFVAHMLGQRPSQRFKVFRKGEKWTIPEE